MPRTNIPYKSTSFFSNKKRTSLSHTHRTGDNYLSESQQGSSYPVNNILVFPKNSETTINVIGDNSHTLPYGNLLKKIRGRKRKEKQRLKKKQNIEGDIKPVVNNVKHLKPGKMKPRMNKHIIFLSDSDSENSELDSQENDKNISICTDATANIDYHKNEEDDDVIFVETPSAEIIEIDDSTEQTEPSERLLDDSNPSEKINDINSPDVNDFLNNDHISLKSKFNFELHGSEFKGAEFLKPSTVPKDMSESGSVSSISDVSASIGVNVFNVVDFPQEKVNLFDDTNLEKFRNSITPQRSNKKSKNVTNDEEYNSSTSLKHNDNLPTLSDIQIEDNSRKQRGRSIIKELVNERAYVILSAAQKKLKSKKRKSKDDREDCSDKGSQYDNQESNKRKKKKKNKKRDTSPNEVDYDRSKSPARIDIVDGEENENKKELRQESEEESAKYSLAIRTDLFESTESETSTNLKKSKKNKKSDSELPMCGEDVEKKKKKLKKNDQDESISEENEQKKKKRIRQISELSVDKEGYVLQENSEEKRKNKVKRNHEVTTDHSNDNNKIELVHVLPQVVEEEEEKKKKKGRKISVSSDGIIHGKNKSLVQCAHDEINKNNEEKRKKKNRNTSSSTSTDIIVESDNTNVDNVSQEEIEVLKENEMKEELELKNNYQSDQDIENSDKKKKKLKKGPESSTHIEHSDNENATYTAKSGKNHDNIEIIEEKCDEVSTKNLPIETLKNQDKNENLPNKSTTSDQGPHRITDNIIQDDSNKLKNVMVNIPDIMGTEVLQKNETYVESPVEENTQMNSKRTSAAPENSDKKQKLEEHHEGNTGDNVKFKKTSEVIKEESLEIDTYRIEVDKENNEQNTDAHIMKYNESTESVSVENVPESSKKRKNDSLISDSIDDPLVSIEPKRIKINTAFSQSQIENFIDNEKGLLENSKVIEKEYNDVISNQKNENITVSVDDVVSVDKSVGNVIEEKTSGAPNLIENSNLDLSVSAELNTTVNSVLIDNEGNIDVKITNVFSLDTSTCPAESSFGADVVVNNSNDKNNSSWNAGSSRFHSYNESLFKDGNGKTLETSNEVSNIEAVSTPVITFPPSLDLKSNQNSALQPVEPGNTSAPGLNETVIVKTEKLNLDSTASSENRTDIISQDVEVKIENQAQDIPKTNVEEKRSDQLILEEKNIPKSISETTNTVPEMLNLELPNDIEKIVKEKDNLDAVKRLCDFLEEASDPNVVLKKVSLLKQAFIEKSQDPVRLQEEVHITYDNDDVYSISSECSSVVCIEDDVSIVSIEDDIALANCSIADGEKEITTTNKTIDSLVARSNHSTEVVSCEIAQNETIENEPSTSQPNLTSTSKSRETQKFKRGLDKYEVEDLQGYMSSDPKLWKIVSEDICPVKLPTKGKRCVSCREIGHLSYNCPNKFNLPKCSLCGIEGHLDFRCPKKLCTQCGRKAPTMRNFCEHCKHYKTLTCTLCKNKGHPKNKCPDLWRRYHLTINNGPLVQRDTSGLKSKENLWCSACAKSGHLEFQCDTSKTWRAFRNLHTFDPRIYYYDDVYETNPRNIPDSIMNNSDAVLRTAHTIRNDDNISSTITSQTDIENVSQETPISSLNKTIENDESIQNTDQSLSSQSNDADGGNKALDASDRRHQNFFMTADIESIKKFVNEELTVLESNRFKLQDLIPRFIAYQEDSKLPEDKSRFGVQRKSKFYKQLNMLLFGKEQLKNGMVHLNKLKHFIRKTPYSLTTQMRESLWNCYDTIFSIEPHEHANYMFFLKLLVIKYGNQKWLG